MSELLKTSYITPTEDVNPFPPDISPQDKERAAKEDYEQMVLRECFDYIRTYKPKWEDFLLKCEENLKEYSRPPDLYGKPAKGAATFVDGSVGETIDWILPSMLQVFGAGDIIKLTPTGPEDEFGVKLLEEKSNLDLQKNIFRGAYDAVADALILKFGVIKCWWEREQKWRSVQWSGLTRDDLNSLSEHVDVQIDKIEIDQDAKTLVHPETGQVTTVEPEKINVTGKRLETYAGSKYLPVPLDELIANPTMKRMSEEPFIAHIIRKQKAELAAEFNIDESEIQYEIELSAQDSFRQERLKDLGGTAFLEDQEDRRYCRMLECYLEIWNKGQKEKLIVSMLGNKILRIEKSIYGRPNFCGFNALRRSHREIGAAVTETIKDLQKLRTGLIRGILENIGYQNNGVGIYNPDKIDSYDLVNNRVPGGLIRTLNGADPSGAWIPAPVQPLATWIFEVLGMTEQMRQDWSGVSKTFEGGRSAGSSTTAAGMSMIMRQSNQKIGLLAQTLGETGLKDLCEMIVWMNVNLMDKETNIRLNGKWEKIKPDDIDVQYDLSLDIGSATGSKEMMVSQLMGVLSQMAELDLKLGIMTPEQIYEVQSEIFRAWGFKTIEGKFLVKPPKPKPLPPPPPPPAQPQGPVPPNGGPPGPPGPPGGPLPQEVDAMNPEMIPAGGMPPGPPQPTQMMGG